MAPRRLDGKFSRLVGVDRILDFIHAYVDVVLFPSQDFLIVVVWYADSFFVDRTPYRTGLMCTFVVSSVSG